MVKVNFVHSAEKYCNKHYHVEVSDEQEEQVEESWAFFARQFFKKTLLLLFSIESEKLARFYEEKEG